MPLNTRIGADAIASKGWLRAYKWFLMRRASQIFFLGLFLLGPWFGLWFVKGNLGSSLTLDVLPLTDPYVLLQSLLAGHVPATTAVTGALIVLAAYFVIGGRAYCAWVCPVNIATDAAYWVRRYLGIGLGARIKRETRLWILGTTFVVAVTTGVVAWELVNPVTMLHRGILFGMGLAWAVVGAVFVFDLLIRQQGWCGHLCPVGAFYSLVGRLSPVRVVARYRRKCNDCMDCVVVCPEPQIIPPVLKGEAKNIGPVILSGECTNCGRCIDVCSKDVFMFGTRFSNKVEAAS